MQADSSSYASGMKSRGKPAVSSHVTPARSELFTDAQVRLLVETVARHRRKHKNQAELAAALGISQPALSNLLHGKWAPGMKTATAIAQLDGYATLEGLIGPIVVAAPVAQRPPPSAPPEERYPRLEACLAYWSGQKTWSPWTVAAARAGFWGDADLTPQEWHERLDDLERILENGRKNKHL